MNWIKRVGVNYAFFRSRKETLMHLLVSLECGNKVSLQLFNLMVTWSCFHILSLNNNIMHRFTFKQGTSLPTCMFPCFLDILFLSFGDCNLHFIVNNISNTLCKQLTFRLFVRFHPPRINSINTPPLHNLIM